MLNPIRASGLQFGTSGDGICGKLAHWLAFASLANPPIGQFSHPQLGPGLDKDHIPTATGAFLQCYPSLFILLSAGE